MDTTTRPNSFHSLWLGLALVLPQTVPAAESTPIPPRPNIVLMYVDNLGYGDLGCYGNTQVKTPRIDQLASEGVRCTDFYVVSSTCTVSRGALLTGRYPRRNGLTHQLGSRENWEGIGLPHSERIMPQYLKEAGYATACFGKWNIGFAPGSRPTERGFDEFLGCRSGNINYFTHTYHGEYDIFQGTERHRVEGYSGEIFADAACEFIRRKTTANQPFFVYLPFNAPHYVSSINMAAGERPQWQAPESAFAAYGWSPDDDLEQHRYWAVVTALDEEVGRVLDTLDAVGQRDNTLVAFVSDMGPILRPTHGLGVASAGGLRDGAPSLYEGGVRVPAIFRWPGRFPAAGTNHNILSHLDLLPMFLAMAGLPLPDDRILDGHDCTSNLAGDGPSPDVPLVFEYHRAAALRRGKYKLVRPRAESPWQLYDLQSDPAESRDLAVDRPETVRELSTAFDDWQSAIDADAGAVARLRAEP